MKELSIEQKAKAYDEALERAEKALEVFGTDKCEGARQIFSLFPELKESEDEKIRKKLISLVKNWDKGGIVSKYTSDANEIKLILAWLEKQGEQKSLRMVSAEAKEAMYSKPTDLEVFINELSKQFPDVSFAKLSRIAVRVAKWAKPTDEEMKELLRTEYEKGRADTIAEMQKSADSHCLDCTNAKGCVNCTDGDMKETGKPCWSEEDKKHIGDIMDYLNDYYSFVKDEDQNVADGVQNEIRWLQHI